MTHGQAGRSRSNDGSPGGMTDLRPSTPGFSGAILDLGRAATVLEAGTTGARVIADGLGCLPFSQAGGALLSHHLSKLYEHTIVMMTTNLTFAEGAPTSVTRK